MSFTVLKYKTWEAIWKKQSKFDDVIVFDEDFGSIARAFQNGQKPDGDVWLTFVDFAPTYKHQQQEHTIKLASYDEVVNKANQWLARYATASHAFSWTVLTCETLYAKILINFAENGEINSKRVSQISKWPLLDDTYLNYFDPNQSLSKQPVQGVMEGRYIVQLLRVWLQRKPPGPVEQKFSGRAAQKIAYKDYWPKMILAKEDAKDFRSNKKVLEKMNEVTDRINLDIANQDTFTGPILNVTHYLSYSTSDDNPLGIANNSDKESELLKSDQITNVVRVFYDVGTDAKQEDLVGFADFIPECISGGGFIKYPKFETQSKLVQKASKWLAQNPEIKFLNAYSVDIKLKSMTSIDSSDMSFMRNTGDFIRILRLCYTKPYETDLVEISDEGPGPSPPPPPPPIYLNCKNIISLKNSTSEIRQRLYEFISSDSFRPDTDIRNRWRFLTAESLSIFTSNNKKTEDIWENSFHAISISSSMMNRSAFNGISLFYDTGYFGKQEEEAQEQTTDDLSNGKVSDDNKPVVLKQKRLCTLL